MNLFFLSCAAIMLLISSCSSPTDTPRNKLIENPSIRTKATKVSFKVMRPGNTADSQVEEEYNCQWQNVEFKLNGGWVTLWIQGICNRPSSWPDQYLPLSLNQLTLQVDSLVVDAYAPFIRSDRPTGAGTKIRLTGMNPLDTDLVYAPTNDVYNNLTIGMMFLDSPNRTFFVPLTVSEYPFGLERETRIMGALYISY